MSTRGEPTLFDGMEQYFVDEAWECLLRDNETYRREVQRRKKRKNGPTRSKNKGLDHEH